MIWYLPPPTLMITTYLNNIHCKALNQAKVVKMLNEVFKPEEARVSLEKLKADELVETVQKHNHGEKYFEDVVKICSTLISGKKMPKVVVASLYIFRIPKPDTDLDNVAAGARMDVMEKKMEGMDKNVTELLRNFKSMLENQVKTVPTLQVPPGPAGPVAGTGLTQGYAQAAARGNGQ